LTASALWQVSVRADPARENQIVALLEARLAVPVAVFQDADSGALTISVYLRELNEPPSRLRRDLAKTLVRPPEAISILRLPSEDWATSWRRHFKPLQIGRQLLIKPSWSRRQVRSGQRVVVLDPGLSFGTGQHPTTRYCLQQLARCRDKTLRQSLMDVGTGSGILAIAAAKLGYAPVEGFDFDPDAVTAARDNARKNRVAHRVNFRHDDLIDLSPHQSQRFDVICANVTYDLLAGQAKKFSRLLTPSGRLVVAGILDEQFQIVTKSFQQFGLTLRQTEANDVWRSGQFRLS